MPTFPVVRPVKAQPAAPSRPVVSPTGQMTPEFQRLVEALWQRTGGFEDDIWKGLFTGVIAEAANVGFAVEAEAITRTLADARLQAEASRGDQLAAQIKRLETAVSLQNALLTAALAQPQQNVTRVVEYTANGTYSLRTGVKAVRVICIGGGGGGGSGASGAPSRGGGGGGAGGGWTYVDLERGDVAGAVTVTVGSAGVGGAAVIGAAGNNGTTGSASRFGEFAYAAGGPGGAGGTGSGGAGGLAPTGGSLFRGNNGDDGQVIAATGASDTYAGCAGGGGGGGLSVGPTANDGGAAGQGSWRLGAAGGPVGGIGGATGGDGGDGTNGNIRLAYGFGGGGGGSGSAGNGGRGGDAGFGSGGGGGGACPAAYTSGRGGNGGAGRVWVLEYY